MYRHYGSAQHTRRRFYGRLKLYSALGLIGGLSIAAFYVVAYSGVFRVAAIELTNISEKDQAYLIMKLKRQVLATASGAMLGTDNYLAWDPDLNYSDVRFAGVAITKDLSEKRIIITARAREPYAIWCNEQAGDTQCYWVDIEGVLFEPAAIPTGQLIKRIDDSAATLHLGMQAIETSWFTIIRDVLNGLDEVNVRVRSAAIVRANQEFRVETVLGATIIFSLRFSPTTSALPAVSRFATRPGLENIGVLDLTVENRAFIR